MAGAACIVAQEADETVILTLLDLLRLSPVHPVHSPLLTWLARLCLTCSDFWQAQELSLQSLSASSPRALEIVLDSFQVLPELGEMGRWAEATSGPLWMWRILILATQNSNLIPVWGNPKLYLLSCRVGWRRVDIWPFPLYYLLLDHALSVANQVISTGRGTWGSEADLRCRWLILPWGQRWDGLAVWWQQCLWPKWGGFSCQLPTSRKRQLCLAVPCLLETLVIIKSHPEACLQLWDNIEPP
jgi:hypothetical protein